MLRAANIAYQLHDHQTFRTPSAASQLALTLLGSVTLIHRIEATLSLC